MSAYNLQATWDKDRIAVKCPRCGQTERTPQPAPPDGYSALSLATWLHMVIEEHTFKCTDHDKAVTP